MRHSLSCKRPEDKGKELSLPGWHAKQEADSPGALPEKQIEKVNAWKESQGASGRVEVPSIQTTAGRDSEKEDGWQGNLC